MISAHTTDRVYEKMGTTRQEVVGFVDTKLNYTHNKYKIMEGKGETFMAACY